MSLIETYQGRKSLFAQKLITKGVTASANDGLTTLINKIDDIGVDVNGVFITGNKSIAQSGDTVTVNATVVNDGELVANTDVLFSTNSIVLETVTSPAKNADMGNDYFVDASSLTSPLYIGRTSHMLICITATEFYFSIDSVPQESYYYTGLIHIKGSVLYYTDSNGEEQSIDISSVKDINRVWNGGAGAVIHKCSKIVTTDYNGMASLSYTCTGVGLIEFTAKSGIFQSEPYSILDTLLYDSATAQDTTKWNNLGVTASYSNDGTNLTPDTDYRYQVKYDVLSDMCVEFDILVPSTVSANPQAYIKGGQPYFSAEWVSRDTWHKIQFKLVNGTYTYFVDGVSKGTGSYNDVIKTFQFRVTSSELTFKNFCIYPI